MDEQTKMAIDGRTDFRLVGETDHPITDEEHVYAVQAAYEMADKWGIDLAGMVAAHHRDVEEA